MTSTCTGLESPPAHPPPSIALSHTIINKSPTKKQYLNPILNLTMSSTRPDREPILPTHVNHSASHRLSTPRISFPSSSRSVLDSPSTSTLVDDGPAPHKYRSRDWHATDGIGGTRQGLPKLSRECLWR